MTASTGDRHDGPMDNVELLITTNFHIWTVSYSAASGFSLPTAVYSEGGRFFGCTWDRDFVYVACNGTLGAATNRDGEWVARLSRKLDTASVWFKSKTLAEVHQICVVKEELWVTSTFYNSLVIVDIATRHSSIYAPLGVTTPPGSGVCGDINHLNTIRFDGSAVYVVANNTKAPRVDGKLRESELLIIDPDRREVSGRMSLNGVTAHDLWREGDEYLSLASGQGAICGTRRRPQRRFAPWLRGVAINDPLMFVGWSPLVPDRSSRNGKSRSALLAVDQGTQDVIDVVEFPDAGALNDVMILNGPDRARFSQVPLWSPPREDATVI